MKRQKGPTFQILPIKHTQAVVAFTFLEQGGRRPRWGPEASKTASQRVFHHCHLKKKIRSRKLNKQTKNDYYSHVRHSKTYERYFIRKKNLPLGTIVYQGPEADSSLELIPETERSWRALLVC